MTEAIKNQLTEAYNRSAFRCTLDEYIAIQCRYCARSENCPHKDAFRRAPVVDGGLGLCKNLKEVTA